MTTSTELIFAPTVSSVEIEGSRQRFPVHRIYCVGRNYSEHALEMGADPVRPEPPFFFAKPADSILASGATIPYPPRTENFQHEVELVVAIGRAGRNIGTVEAPAYVFGYAVGIDLTRRDLQAAAKKKGWPWDTSKGFDASAPIGAIRPATRGHLQKERIWLEVNGQMRQQSDIGKMIWSVPEIIAELSSFFELRPGDLIYTGTPAGVGPLAPGDRIGCGIDGLPPLSNTVSARPG